MDWKFTVVGLLTGLLVGMTGMGGGSLMTRILVFLFGIPPTTAIGTDIAHGAAFKSVSAVQHRRMGNVRARLAGWMLIGSAPDVAARRLGQRAAHGALRRRRRVGAWGRCSAPRLLFGAVGLVAKSLVHSGASGDRDWKLTNRDRVAAVLIGVFGGFIVGLTSVGSGVFFGLTLLVIFPLRAHKVVGHGHLPRGRAPVRRRRRALGRRERRLRAARLAPARLDPRRADRRTADARDPRACLRLLLAGVLGLAGIKLLDVPGAGVIVVVALSAGLVALLVCLGRHSWIRIQRGRDTEYAVRRSE